LTQVNSFDRLPLIISIVASSSVVVSEELELELLLILSEELDQVAFSFSSYLTSLDGHHIICKSLIFN
ncbi:MAG: hypothetical protein ACK55Z_02830, partial [bacterium]